jgi:ketosteroid isomerase-like protein
MRVPTEGAVATTHVMLEIPADVTVLEVLPAEGATFETTKQGERITSITWKKTIPTKASAEFAFRARNPAGTEIVWKAHQHFNDGTVADWTGAAGASRPAAVTKLSASAAGAQPNDAATVEAWLKTYDAAFNAKDLDKLATFYHPDVTIYEGGGINNGWIDYRDRHLGPELKSFEDLQFGHSNTKVLVLPGGQSAYATSEYAIKAKMGDRQLDSGGLETLVLVKNADGMWKIRHSHTSSRARRPQA